ncbi:MAG TPA: MBL fold metallo-hydrolase [Ramlibacter sp.]|nr:MBL fold metallo-hydrolase [Ramlibacter sp.]
MSQTVFRQGSVSVHLGEKSGKYPDGNQVIVRGSQACAAFDTPLVANRIGREFEQVDLVILGHVHEDHMAGLHLVPQASVHVHNADLAAAQSWEGLARHYGYPPSVLVPMKKMIESDFHYRPRPDAEGYEDGATWDLGGGVRVRAQHMPGHTAGHCVLVVENEGIAFLGDIDLTGFGPYYGDACSNLADFRRTLAAVADVEARTWVTSHHRGVLTDRAHFLAELARFTAKIDERAERLLGYLGGGPLSIGQLVQRRLLYPPGYDIVYVESAERRSIELHLEELIAQGRVRAVGEARFEKI